MQGKGEEGEEEKNHSRDRRKEGRMTGVRKKERSESLEKEGKKEADTRPPL